jgi:gluconate 5-dehydrogenase
MGIPKGDPNGELERVSDPFSMKGRTVFVAGASRGIGLAIARAMAAAGARTIMGARSEDVLARHASDLRSQGYDARHIAFDATDSASVDRLMDQLPPLDVLVPVQGTNVRKPFVEYSGEEYRALMQLNLDSIVDIVLRVGRRMIDHGSGGKIITIGSVAVAIGVPNVAVYAATKGAVAALTRALAAEWAPYDIQVNCIVPGIILTDLNRAMWESSEMQAWLRTVQANPRLGLPEDVAPLAVFLAGRGADYITGQLIATDGGYTVTKMWPFSGDPG